MIIAYSGAHGTGKTTAVFKLEHRLKIDYPTKRVGVLHENAGACPYPINLEMSRDGQLWIFTNQIQAELALLRRYDVLVSDRTCVDAIAYTQVGGFFDLAEAMLAVSVHHVKLYRTIVFRSIHTNDHCHADGLRCHKNPMFRQEVESALYALYERLGLTDNTARFVYK